MGSRWILTEEEEDEVLKDEDLLSPHRSCSPQNFFKNSKLNLTFFLPKTCRGEAAAIAASCSSYPAAAPKSFLHPSHLHHDDLVTPSKFMLTQLQNAPQNTAPLGPRAGERIISWCVPETVTSRRGLRVIQRRCSGKGDRCTKSQCKECDGSARRRLRA